MFPNKPIVMNPEAFRYFHVFPLTVRARARTEDGNNLLHSELLFKINYCITTRYPSLFDAGGFIPSLHSFLVALLAQPNRAKALSVCSKLDPSAIQVFAGFPED